MHDQYGRPVWQGDTVTIKGHVVDVVDDPNYLNCTVQLEQQLPPSGAEIKIDLNTAQLIKQGPEDPPYLRPLPWTHSRLEAMRSARKAAILRVYLDIGQIKQMVNQLAAIKQQQAEASA